MHEWMAAQLAAGFPAFAGSTISGTFAVQPEAINELIARWLAGDGAPSGSPAIDPQAARKAIKSARVRAESGKILIDVEISV